MGNAGDKILYSSSSLSNAARRLQQVGAALQQERSGLLSTLSELDNGNGGDCRIQGRIHLTTVGASYSAGTIDGFIRDLAQALTAEGSYAKDLAGRLNKISEMFAATERELTGQINSLFEGDSPFKGAGGAAGDDASWQEMIKRVLALIGKPGAWGYDTSILGIGWTVNLGWDLLNGNADAYSNSAADWKTGNVYTQNGFDLSGYIGKLTASNQFGIFSNDMSITAITAGVNGTIGGSLLQNGKILPAIWGNLSAEGTVLEANVNQTIGNDQWNVHFNGEAKGLTASAEAKGNLGFFERLNDSGRVITEVTAEGKVGAEAWLGTLRGEQGYTIFGIDIDVGVEGKFGGAGASAGGKISSTGVKVDLDAGLAAGMGLDVSIDWSDCPIYNWEMPKLSDLNWFG